ncbi:MAG: SDR family oxidoreductase [Acidimicrobiales bacterium]|nr:SDR family oxidoreductase [Acidimicrobiales bacterium]
MKEPNQKKVAVITGGGSGVGAAAAQALDSRGWITVICGRRLEPLQEASAQMQNPNLSLALDISKPTAVEELFSSTVEAFSRVDLLFNNAGIGAAPVPIEELPVDAWRDVVDINLTGTWLCSRAAFDCMKRQKPAGGRIINNGSVSAQTPRPFSSPYTATKHAITGLTKALSLEGREHGITVGQIDIGNALTPLTNQMTHGVLQADGSIREESTMNVSNVADAVVLLAELPPDVNVPQMTIMANEMPLIGRG